MNDPCHLQNASDNTRF